MQRRKTKTTRGPNSEEKAYHGWIKEIRQTCAACGNKGPVIGHHCEGATFKHNKTLVGHWYFIGLCQSCDDIVTHGSRKAFRDAFGPQCLLWDNEIGEYLLDTGSVPPQEVSDAILDWGR